MTEKVLVCSDCDSTNIRKTPSLDSEAYCNECSCHVEPLKREARSSTATYSDKAKILWDMDPDEI